MNGLKGQIQKLHLAKQCVFQNRSDVRSMPKCLLRVCMTRHKRVFDVKCSEFLSMTNL